MRFFLTVPAFMMTIAVSSTGLRAESFVAATEVQEVTLSPDMALVMRSATVDVPARAA